MEMRRALVILFLSLLTAILVGTGVTAQTPIALWVFAEPPEVVEWLESWERRFNAENPDVSPVWAYIKVNHALQQLGHLVVEPLGTVGRIPRDAGVAALQYRHNLMEAGTRGAPLPGWGEFNSGRLAGWQGGFNTDQTIAAIREGVAAVARRFPGPTPGTDSVMGNSGTVFMLTTTRHPQEAWRVMVAFAAPETSKEYLLVSRRFLPARRSLIDDPELRARPFAEEEIRVAYPPIFPYGSSHPLYPHFRELVGAPLQKAIEGTMAFDVALDEAERILNLELARWAQER